MAGSKVDLIEAAPLRHLLHVPASVPASAPTSVPASAPAAQAGEAGLPVLCFLHGYDEAAPMDIRRALTLHGPLRAESRPHVVDRFIVVAPQLPAAGDHWYRHADAVRQIVTDVRSEHGGDPTRTYLTGFSFGGNGVFDLALMQPDFWAALWAVDPTRYPQRDPGRPVWLSLGEISRHGKDGFVRTLKLASAEANTAGDRLFLDQGEDHVGSATLAYQDERIYGWLLSRRLAA